MSLHNGNGCADRPALETLAECVRLWTMRQLGPSAVPVAISIRLKSGERIATPLPEVATPLPLVKAPDAPPARSRNVSDDAFAEIASVLAARGAGMTARQIMSALDRAGQSRSDSVVRHTLAYFVRVDRLVKSDDGYCLPAD
jgi:hypothetical protein